MGASIAGDARDRRLTNRRVAERRHHPWTPQTAANPARGVLDLLKRAADEFLNDDCMTLAAALSYYTVFSLPPLLLLILLLLGSIMSPDDVRGTLETQINAIMGPAGSEQVRTILTQAHAPSGNVGSTIIGIAALLFGATGAFAELQQALNRVWDVGPDPSRSGFRTFVTKRLLSAGMIVVIAFLLLVSLVLSALLSAFGAALGRMLGSGVSGVILWLIDAAISVGVVAGVFAAVFKVLPDADIKWRDVWVGAAFTTMLFLLGKYLLGIYLGHSHPGQAFGAAQSLALLFLWIYYSSIILLFGAEFTAAWARQHGGIRPEDGAVRMQRVERPLGPAAPAS